MQSDHSHSDQSIPSTSSDAEGPEQLADAILAKFRAERDARLATARRRLVVLSGAGLSAPSGLRTFRDSGGLWERHRIEDVATPDAWRANPARVLEFYNKRRLEAAAAVPNEGHRAIAALEPDYEVVVITQNVDDLHERAGSSWVIHLHGELSKARSTVDPRLIYPIGTAPIHMGDHCSLGSQLRPDIVWFGEEVPRIEEAIPHLQEAGTLIVVGTSLSVFPAASLIDHVPSSAVKILVDIDPPEVPAGFRVLEGSAELVLPNLVRDLLGRIRAQPRREPAG